MTNTQRDRTVDVTVSVTAEGGCKRWDLLTGQIASISCRSENGRQIMNLSFPPVGSHLVVVDKSTSKVRGSAEEPKRNHTRTRLGDTWQASRGNPNALSLDYCRFNINDGGWSEPTATIVARNAIGNAGYGSTYRLEYSFESSLESKDSRELLLAVESPERFRITVNGRPVAYAGEGYWIDPAFKTMDIRELLAVGRNVVELHGKVGIHEIRAMQAFAETRGPEVESCYIVGDFAVRNTDNTAFALVDEPGSVRTGDLVAQGYPFYPGTISLTQELDAGSIGGRAWLEFSGLQATVAEVTINGKDAGPIFLRPHEIEITRHLAQGTNVVCVKLVNTLRNLLGPLHHAKGELKWVFPESFLPVGKWFGSGQSEWTDRYNFVPFGFDAVHLLVES